MVNQHLEMMTVLARLCRNRSNRLAFLPETQCCSPLIRWHMFSTKHSAYQCTKLSQEILAIIQESDQIEKSFESTPIDLGISSGA